MALSPCHMLGLFLFAIAMPWTPGPAQEVRKLRTDELDAAFKTPAKPIRPGSGIPGSRSARRPNVSSPSEVSRKYSRGARVIIFDDGQTAEAPYAEIPLLFKKGKAELLDDSATQANLRLLASKVVEYGNGGSRFVIEGHASAEGDGKLNQTLSEERARMIVRQLTSRFKVPSDFVIRAEGRGSRDAQAPADANEKELKLDRKVLAVKEADKP